MAVSESTGSETVSDCHVRKCYEEDVDYGNILVHRCCQPTPAPAPALEETSVGLLEPDDSLGVLVYRLKLKFAWDELPNGFSKSGHWGSSN